jgi:hypothetical protein
MERTTDKRIVALLAAWLGAAIIFAIDYFAAPEIVITSLYILPLLLLMWWGKKRDVYLTTLFCIGLLALAFYIAPAKQELPFALVNRLIEAAVLLTFALAIGRRIDSRRELVRQHSRLKRLLDERSRALEVLMTQQRSDPAQDAELSTHSAETDPSGDDAAWIAAEAESLEAQPAR